MKLSPESRRQTILKEIELKGETDIYELSKKLQVSEMTIRRDIKKLEENGKLLRTCSGAVSINQSNGVEDALNKRIMKNKEEKAIIASAASEFIENDDVIMIDASTTALALCRHINNKKITVVTNSLSVATTLSAFEKVTVVVVCGMLRHNSLSLVGPYVAESFKKFNINKCFLSAKALSFESGLTDINMLEVETKKAAIESSKEVIVLVDNSKLNKISLLKVCDHNNISKVVIDGLREFSNEEKEMLSKFKNAGIEIIIVN